MYLDLDYGGNSSLVFVLAPLLESNEGLCACLSRGEQPVPIANIVKSRGCGNKPNIFFFLHDSREPNPRFSASTHKKVCT
jgi:hypothetical protein